MYNEIINTMDSIFSTSIFSIRTLSITSLFDMVIVAIITYYLLLWTKKTHAWSLFKGVITLVAVWIVAYIFKLYTLSWIISNTFNVGIIAIIILFQPEIRKALEQLGRNSPLNFNENVYDTSSKVINEILTACEKMSAKKTGALIVIEQNTPLGEYESTGVAVDSIVTSQLLGNIFYDKSPLHDGAVIIKKDRIAAASCILPLTNQEIGKDLGTRHRAGYGVSEVTDAYVIVVSEETGSISLGHKGELFRDISIDEIRKLIMFDEKIDSSKNNHYLAKRLNARRKRGAKK